MKKLIQFYADCGRMGDLEGVFIDTEENLREIIGKKVDFGECLGKHSEIIIEMEESMFTLTTLPEDVIGLLEEVKITSGFNPITEWEYYREDREAEEEGDQG
jgi:hypothetical protein